VRERNGGGPRDLDSMIYYNRLSISLCYEASTTHPGAGGGGGGEFLLKFNKQDT
jgi:hypothetical protein